MNDAFERIVALVRAGNIDSAVGSYAALSGYDIKMCRQIIEAMNKSITGDKNVRKHNKRRNISLAGKRRTRSVPSA